MVGGTSQYQGFKEKIRVITNVSFQEQNSKELHYNNSIEKGSNLSSHFQECIINTTRACLYSFVEEQSKTFG